MSPKHLEKVKKYLDKKLKVRSEMQKHAKDVQQKSKRAIFAYHRDNAKQAQDLLKEAQSDLVKVRKGIKAIPDMSHAGFYREAMEEYVEARLYEGFLESRKILKNDEEWGDVETYIGGLSDATGEVGRWAIARATEHDMKSVEAALIYVNDVVEFFLSLDLTGYLRNKGDQAKKNLRNLEQIRYDMSRL